MDPLATSANKYRKAFTLIIATMGVGLIGDTVFSLLRDTLSYPNSWKVLFDPVIITMLVISPFLYSFIAKPLREIAERQRQMNEVLEGERKNLKAIFEATPVGMMLIDQTMTVQKVNGAMGMVTMRNSNDMVNTSLDQALGLTDKSHTQSECKSDTYNTPCSLQSVVLDALEKGESIYGLEMPFVVDNKGHRQERWIHVNAVPTLVLGQRHALLLIEDVTRRRENERKIKEAKEQAEKARQDLQTANQKLEEAAEYATMLADEAIAANVAKSRFFNEYES